MTSDGWTVVGTIAGIVIGSALAILGQRLEWGRQQRIRWDATRHEVYGKYIGSCNAYFIALCEVRRAARNDHSKLGDATTGSERLRAEVAALKGQVDLLAGKETRHAGDSLQEHLDGLNTQLYDAIRNLKQIARPEIARTDELRSKYKVAQDKFLNAVNLELKIRRG